jgi:hypothetical protein
LKSKSPCCGLPKIMCKDPSCLLSVAYFTSHLFAAMLLFTCTAVAVFLHLPCTQPIAPAMQHFATAFNFPSVCFHFHFHFHFITSSLAQPPFSSLSPTCCHSKSCLNISSHLPAIAPPQIPVTIFLMIPLVNRFVSMIFQPKSIYRKGYHSALHMLFLSWHITCIPCSFFFLAPK